MKEFKHIVPKTAENEQVFALVEEMLREGTSVKLRVRGNSMSPALIDGKDTVLLEPLSLHPGGLSVGDVVLFKYKGGFLMHRIIEIKDLIITKGDALSQTEAISSEEVIAVAKFREHCIPIMWFKRCCRSLLRNIQIFQRGQK